MYKRQEGGRDIDYGAGLEVVHGAYVHKGLQLGHREAEEGRVPRADPVSYTHLDVYKRQHLLPARGVLTVEPLQQQRQGYHVLVCADKHLGGEILLPEACLLYTSRCV